MSAQPAYLARNAARNAAAIFRVELCCGAQAVDFLDDGLELGVGSAEAYDAVRAVVPKLTAGRPVHEDIEAAGAPVESPAFTERVAAALDEEFE